MEDLINNVYNQCHLYFKLMVIGRRGRTGAHAQSRVAAELDPERGCATIPHLNMADISAREITQTMKLAIHAFVRLIVTIRTVSNYVTPVQLVTFYFTYMVSDNKQQ